VSCKVLAEFPLEPRLSKVLLSSLKLGCVDEAVTVAAMLGVSKDLWLQPRGRLKAKEKLDAAMADFAVRGKIG
jgi:HrpA-like RNA helicase